MEQNLEDSFRINFLNSQFKEKEKEIEIDQKYSNERKM